MADAPASSDPDRCMACRGSGRVISTLGGSPNAIPCPWCEGTGKRIPGHDAQAAQRAGGGGDDEPPAAA